MKKIAFKAVALCWPLLMVACSSDESTPPSPKELYKQDREHMAKATMSTSGVQSFNLSNNDAFFRAFGGNTFKSVDNYISNRIKYIWDDNDYNSHRLSNINILDKDNLKWIEDANDLADDGMVAMNYGTILWILSRVHGENNLRVTSGADTIYVDSTRTGLIVLSSNYAGSIHGVTLPPEYREETLVHESRHSDCSSGFPDDYVRAARSATDINDFLRKINKNQIPCGHLHVACPPGHDLAGISACDNEEWGGYGIGAVFSGAAQSNYPSDSIEARVLQINTFDSMTRLLGDSPHDTNTRPD